MRITPSSIQRHASRKWEKNKRRERVLSNDEMKRLWAELDRDLTEDTKLGGITFSDLPAALSVRRAIKLLFALGQRRGETIGMGKSELDLTADDCWWTIPGERTKNGLPHRVPLTKTACVVLQEALAASGESEFASSLTENGPGANSCGCGHQDIATDVRAQSAKHRRARTTPYSPHCRHQHAQTWHLGRRSRLRFQPRLRGKIEGDEFEPRHAGEHDDEKRRVPHASSRATFLVIVLASIP